MAGSSVQYPNAPGTRQGSPDTAHRAGRSFKAEALNRRLEALGCVRGQGANGATCDEVAKFWRKRLPVDVETYAEMHALLIQVGIEHCRASRPKCEGCPLQTLLPKGGPITD